MVDEGGVVDEGDAVDEGVINNCFETSSNGGCSDDQCLEQVCSEIESCCTTAYDSSCVLEARENAASCAPPPESTDNSCLQTSLFGGCNDVLCETEVCTVRPLCCASEVDNNVGEWSQECVSLASDICTL
jgi:hypothetical protein